ncbi:MAG TPA: glutaredoxin domain-containing protein [Caldilineaceae bacterium]|nr:glutaredoxin domain-containing protein [Caldilineaceae bacterium]
MTTKSIQPVEPRVIMYTTRWCGDCWRAKQVMEAMQVPYTEIDISHDEEATELVMRLNRGYRSVPTLVFPDGSVLTEPRPNVLMQKLQELAE